MWSDFVPNPPGLDGIFPTPYDVLHHSPEGKHEWVTLLSPFPLPFLSLENNKPESGVLRRKMWSDFIPERLG